MRLLRVGNERFGRPRNPDFLLRPRELLDAFARLRVLAFEDGIIAGPTPVAIQRLAAVKLEPDAIEPVETLAAVNAGARRAACRAR